MRIIFTPLLTALFFSTLTSFAQKTKVAMMDDCDKVQSLLNRLPDFQGALINDDAFECRREYILDEFTGARIIVPGKEAKYWTVNMNTEEMQKVEAESKYLERRGVEPLTSWVRSKRSPN